MKKFEYRITCPAKINEKGLNELGEEGWELISIIKIDLNLVFYYKREKK